MKWRKENKNQIVLGQTSYVSCRMCWWVWRFGGPSQILSSDLAGWVSILTFKKIMQIFLSFFFFFIGGKSWQLKCIKLKLYSTRWLKQVKMSFASPLIGFWSVLPYLLVFLLFSYYCFFCLLFFWWGFIFAIIEKEWRKQRRTKRKKEEEIHYLMFEDSKFIEKIN